MGGLLFLYCHHTMYIHTYIYIYIPLYNCNYLYLLTLNNIFPNLPILYNIYLFLCIIYIYVYVCIYIYICMYILAIYISISATYLLVLGGTSSASRRISSASRGCARTWGSLGDVFVDRFLRQGWLGSGAGYTHVYTHGHLLAKTGDFYGIIQSINGVT